MYQVGHYGVALLTYAPLGTVVALAGYETAAIIGVLACLALSTLPDCDHKLPLIEHRGPTHSLVFAVLVGGGVAAITMVVVDTPSPAGDLGIVTFAFAVGTLSILSHLLADALTPMGVRPFWPISGRHYTLSVTKAANPLANYVLFCFGLGSVFAGGVLVVTFG